MARFAPKRILVPMDFSRFSQEALQTAVGLMDSRDARLIAVHVMEKAHTPFAYGDESVGLVEENRHRESLAADARELLDGAMQQASVRDRAETVVVWGDPANEIVRIAEAQKADLIVMSTHGRTGLERLVMGSVAEKVIRHSPCPTLILRAAEKAA